MDNERDEEKGLAVRTKRAGLAVAARTAHLAGFMLSASAKVVSWRGLPWVAGGALVAGGVVLGENYLILYWHMFATALGM